MNGQTNMIQRHMDHHHKKEWHETIIREKLKGWEKLRRGSEQGEHDVEDNIGSFEPFTLAGFVDRLGEVMVDNNLVCSTFST